MLNFLEYDCIYFIVIILRLLMLHSQLFKNVLGKKKRKKCNPGHVNGDAELHVYGIFNGLPSLPLRVIVCQGETPSDD